MLKKYFLFFLLFCALLSFFPRGVSAQAVQCTHEVESIQILPANVKAGQSQIVFDVKFKTSPAPPAPGSTLYLFVGYQSNGVQGTSYDGKPPVQLQVFVDGSGGAQAVWIGGAPTFNGTYAIDIFVDALGRGRCISPAASFTITDGQDRQKNCAEVGEACDPGGVIGRPLCDPEANFCAPDGVLGGYSVQPRNGLNAGGCIKNPDGKWACRGENLVPSSQDAKCSCEFDKSDPTAYKFCTTTGGQGLDTAAGCIPLAQDNSAIAITGFILKWAIGIVGGIGFLLIIFAGLMIITSTGDPEKLKSGRDLLVASLSGMLMILFSVFILRFIGINIIGI